MENVVNERELKKYYSLLEGIEDTLDMYYDHIPDKVAYMYNDCIKTINTIINDEIILNFLLDKEDRDYYSGESGYHVLTVTTKITPLMKYLKDNYINDDVTKIGALYSNIENQELQKRCLDILSSKDAYDRVINQATLVLENAIKEKANLQNSGLFDLALVSKAINPQEDKTILLFSEEKSIQEAYSFLYKGVIGAFRNPTHHGINYKCTREDALKCCAFIDFLLKELEHSKNIKN